MVLRALPEELLTNENVRFVPIQPIIIRDDRLLIFLGILAIIGIVGIVAIFSMRK